MNKIFYIQLIILMLISCNSNKLKKPDDLISKSLMVSILEDVFLLNSTKSINKKLVENNNIIPETYILKQV